MSKPRVATYLEWATDLATVSQTASVDHAAILLASWQPGMDIVFISSWLWWLELGKDGLCAG